MHKVTYTFFIQAREGGTTFIETRAGACRFQAAREILEHVALVWQCDVKELHVLGVALGEVKILHWQDLNELE